jgi:predicted transposase YbfD/YdcC
LIRLDKEIRCEGKTLSFETRYFISSLDPDVVSASEFQELILRHWEIENCLNGQKDRFYDEDKHVLGRDSWGKAWTVLTNMALSLGQLLWRGERTKNEIRERCYINPMPIAKKLGWTP